MMHTTINGNPDPANCFVSVNLVCDDNLVAEYKFKIRKSDLGCASFQEFSKREEILTLNENISRAAVAMMFNDVSTAVFGKRYIKGWFVE